MFRRYYAYSTTHFEMTEAIWHESKDLHTKIIVSFSFECKMSTTFVIKALQNAHHTR